MSGAPSRQVLALAEHYLGINNPKKALETLGTSESDSIDDPYFWFLLGSAYYDLDRNREAREAAKKGLARAPESIDLLFLLCDTESKLDNPAAAERAILSALRESPEQPRLLCRYALLVAQNGQLEKAERLVEEAAVIDPESLMVTRTRSWIAYLRGDDKNATEGLQEALAIEAEDESSHFLLGLSLSSQGKVSQADRSFQSAVSGDPSHDAFRRAARASAYASHWLLIPLRPVQRFGQIPVWIACVGTVFALNLFGLSKLALIAAIIYLIFVVYSWTVPGLLMKWFERNDRGFR